MGNPTEILRWLQGTSQREACVVEPPKTPTSKELRVFLRDTLGAIATDVTATAQGAKTSSSVKVDRWQKKLLIECETGVWMSLSITVLCR